MEKKRFVAFGIAFIGLSLTLVAAPLHGGQSASSPEVPRAIDGKPDLGGVWDFRTLTPLQRPEQQSESILTNEQAAEVEANAVQRAVDADRPSEIRTELLPAGGNVGGYNNFWFDRGAGVVADRRTSLITDPPNGRLPAVKDSITMQETTDAESGVSDRPVRFRVGGVGMDGPEDRGLAERCLLGFNTGPPIVPGGYNQNIQLFQTADHLVIFNEMVHDARIVPLDGRERPSSELRQWNGTSRGYWDGDTLVVETRNFTDNTASFGPTVRSAIGSGLTMQLTERFRRIDNGTLMYEFTVDDSTSFAAPFTAVVPMTRGEQPLFEYACHEGNYGMFNLLSGARAKASE